MRAEIAEAGVCIVPLGDIDSSLVAAVAEEAGMLLGCRVCVAPRLALNGRAFETRGWQYSSIDLLCYLRTFCEGQGPTLAITDIDLSYPGLNYIFGLADETYQAAVVSISRFRGGGERPGAGRSLIGRTVKTVVHELGHLMGLSHCSDRRCVMSFSHNVGDTDYKGRSYCGACSRKAGIVSLSGNRG